MARGARLMRDEVDRGGDGARLGEGGAGDKDQAHLHGEGHEAPHAVLAEDARGARPLVREVSRRGVGERQAQDESEGGEEDRDDEGVRGGGAEEGGETV